MQCFDINLLFDQLCEKEPEEWFVLHMVGCKECRENLSFIRLLRDVLQEINEHEEVTGQPLDESARYWMLWMSGDKPPIKSVV